MVPVIDFSDRSGWRRLEFVALLVLGLLITASVVLLVMWVAGFRQVALAAGNRASQDTGRQAASKYEIKQQIENNLAARVESYFRRLNIPAVATVSVSLDHEKVSRHIRRIDPEDKGGFIMQEVREKQTRQLIPDLTAPLLDTETGAGAIVSDFENATPATRERRENTFDYEIVTELIVKAPGELARVRASVVLFKRKVVGAPGEAGQPVQMDLNIEQNMETFRRHVANAIGADLAKDKDAIEILYLPQAGPSETPRAGTAARVLAFLTTNLGLLAVGGALALVLLFLLLLTFLLRPRPAPDLTLGPAPASARPEELGGETRIHALRQGIERVVEREPRRAATQLSSWLTGE